MLRKSRLRAITDNSVASPEAKAAAEAELRDIAAAELKLAAAQTAANDFWLAEYRTSALAKRKAELETILKDSAKSQAEKDQAQAELTLQRNDNTDHKLGVKAVTARRDLKALMRGLIAVIEDPASTPEIKAGAEAQLRVLEEYDRFWAVPDSPGSHEHKAAAWAAYQERGGTLAYAPWSNVSHAAVLNALKGNEAANDLHALLGWGERELTVTINGRTRRLDIGDSATRRGVEVKTGYITLNDEIKYEIERDAELKAIGWDIRWHFAGGASASSPLIAALDAAGIPYTFGN